MNHSPAEAMIAQISGTKIDPEIFIQSVGVYQRAASGVDPTSRIRPKRQRGQRGIQLTDIPVNRGMLAVMRLTRDLDDHSRRALALRLLCLGAAVDCARKDARFCDVIAAHDADNTYVEDSFFRAFATCQFVKGPGEEIGPDLDDLHRILIGGGLS